MNRTKRALALIGGTCMAAGQAMATGETIPDPSSIIATATTQATAVCVLVAGLVGFFVVVKIVKWIRK